MAVTANNPKAVSGVIDGDCKASYAGLPHIDRELFAGHGAANYFCKFSAWPRSTSRNTPVTFEGSAPTLESVGPSPRDGSVLRKSFNRSALPSRDRASRRLHP